MLKGIQKRIIVIKTQKDSCFESAFFIIRSEKERNCDENAIITEAQRIIADGERARKKKNKRSAGKRAVAAIILALACGMVCGAAAVLILCLIFG